MFTPKLFHAIGGRILEQSEHHIVYASAQGETNVSVYAPLSGVEVAWLNFKADCFEPGIEASCADAIEITHCREGRAEFTMRDGCVQFQGMGDLFISAKSNHSERIELPLGLFGGVAITIDWCIALPSLQTHLPEMAIELPTLMERFLSSDECFMVQANEQLTQLFAGLYSAPSALRLSYSRLKVLELLLYLSDFDAVNEVQKDVYARKQVDIIKQVRHKLVSEMEKRFTIEALAKEFCMSPTTLKENFRGVYGQPIAAYMKSMRMQKACELLRQSALSIGEIAQRVGYESQSKFGAAFKDEMHVTPNMYRRGN